jgi:hypothetical protein
MNKPISHLLPCPPANPIGGQRRPWHVVGLRFAAVFVVALLAVALDLFAGSSQSEKKADQALLKPLNLAALNTAADEDDPFLARDGSRLLYASNASKRFTLMASSLRAGGRADKWPPGVELEGQNADTDNRTPFLTADNHDLYYAEKTDVKAPAGENRPPPNFDIAHAIRLTKPTQFTGPTYVQSACTADEEIAPWLTEDDLELYFSRKTKDGWRVFVARRPAPVKKQPKGAFGEPVLVKELPAGYHHATLSRSKQTMYLQGPLDNNRWGLFRAKRVSGSSPWGKPEPLERLNHPQATTGDRSPCLSRDGSKLYFSSDRPGGKGGLDLWVIDTRWFN